MMTPLRSCASLVLFVCVGLFTSPASIAVQAQTPSTGWTWASVGSAGVPDESVASLVSFANAAASLRSTAPTGTVAIVRYPVTFTSGYYVLAWNGNIYTDVFHKLILTMIFKKNDEQGYVSAALKRVRLSDGVESYMNTVTSLAAIPAAGVQSEERTIQCPELCIDLSQYAYYIEAVLWKPVATNDPKLLVVRVQQHY
jgi:hypothetical protein